MISVDELKRRSETGMTCNICGANDRVLALRFKPDHGIGGTTVYLCRSCRVDLAIELELAANEEDGSYDR